MGLLCSHNTFTYRKPKKWYLRPISFIARCQSLDYKAQVEKFGVKAFDMRIFFTKNGDVEFRHGFFSYDASDIYEILDFCRDNKIVVRIMLENRSFLMKKVRKNNFQALFKWFLEDCIRRYPTIRFYRGCDLYTGLRLVDFLPNYAEVGFYSSQTSLFESENKFLRVIDDWCPRIYASIKNEKCLELVDDYDDNTIVLYDFIEKGRG